MEITAHEPAPVGLLHHIQAFWQVERLQANHFTETIVPKGSIELIFNLEEERCFKAVIANNNFSVPRCFISGYHTAPIQLTLPVKQVFFGVVFHITALKKLFRTTPGDFANNCIDITENNKEIYSLWHRLGEAKNFNERTKLFTIWLQHRKADVCYREQLFDKFLNNHAARVSPDALSK